MTRRRLVLTALLACALSGCAMPVDHSTADGQTPVVSASPPTHFTIVPDAYHVPYAGTAADGRKFFLSDELFDVGTPTREETSYVGLYLWNPDGSFAEVRVDSIARRAGLPPEQGSSAGADALIKKRLAELGNYKLEPITVEPFVEMIDGVTFGWAVTEFEGQHSINIEPGNFIAYYEPWDGLEYDT